MSLSVRPPPWSLLRTQWLEVPAGEAVRRRVTWGTFSEVFESCLQDLVVHVRRRVHDRSSLGEVVTTVLVENLDVLVSPLDEREKLRLLFAAADLLVARKASTDSDETGGCERGDRQVKIFDRTSDT